MTNTKIRVLIVDDSAVIRHLLTEILNQAGDIEVVGTAHDPIFAAHKIKALSPDVITLDIEMPRMDGLAFLEELMKTDPIPVIMVSGLTQKGCETTIKALELGAVDYVPKPRIDISSGVVNLADEIIKKVRIASKAKVRKIQKQILDLKSLYSQLQIHRSELKTTTDKIIAIGASTGGTQAISGIITALPESTPGIVIAQHMPPLFISAFAGRLNSISGFDVKEARAGDRVLRGTVLIAPGDEHMTIRRNGALYYTEIKYGPLVNFVRPSIDVLFSAVAKYAGKNAIGIILTGMGEDGAKGLLEMKEAGAFTIAQDEDSSIVFGMPRKAIELNAVNKIASLTDIPRIILEHI